MSPKLRAKTLRRYYDADWKDLTKRVYGVCYNKNYPYTIKNKNKLLTKAHKMGLV